MKKTFVLLALSFTVFTTQAQVNFGVKAGANLTNFSGSDVGESAKSLLGYAGGALVNYNLTEAVSLQGEVLYSLEGTSYKFEDVKMKNKMSYINIPILAQYNHTSGFYAETGPQLGILASAKVTGKVDGRTQSQDIKDEFKSTNFSWAFGLGYKLPNGLGIGARYNLGLTNVPDNSDANVKLGGFHLGLSYTFGSSN